MRLADHLQYPIMSEPALVFHIGIVAAKNMIAEIHIHLRILPVFRMERKNLLDRKSVV